MTSTADSGSCCVIGVDIGGTKVAAGLVDREGEIGEIVRVPMPANGDAAAGFQAVTSTLESLLAKATATRNSIRAIGVCAPGPLDPKSGVVINPPNLPGWRNFPLGSEISRRYLLPVKLDNDANAAALAEVRWGAGRGYSNVFYVTIGTGIGTGIVIDGRIFHGRTGAAAEGGHVSIDYNGPRCGCGKRGCIEVLASGPAIVERARTRLAKDPAANPSKILELAHGKIDQITSEIIGQANAEGDPVAGQVLLDTIELLSVWLGNVIDLLEPDVVIIGGGVAAMLHPFFGEIRARLARWCINSRFREIPIVMAHYGANSGIAGAAALCNQESESA
ncbi:MAG: ROK family protein [Candidatus Acidiferrales bacterium]